MTQITNTDELRERLARIVSPRVIHTPECFPQGANDLTIETYEVARDATKARHNFPHYEGFVPDFELRDDLADYNRLIAACAKAQTARRFR